MKLPIVVPAALFAVMYLDSSCLWAQVPPVAASREEQVVTAAATVLDEVMAIPANAIPQSLLANAQAVAIIPSVVKGGFVVGVRHGRGVVLIRDEIGQWQAPRFVTLTSGSIGWQAGIQSTDLIMVFQTRQSVNALLNGRMTVGVDAAAAAGPVGRQVTAATDISLSAEILSYSRSRGLFAGFALDGAAIQIDNMAAARFYQHNAGVNAAPTMPASAVALINRLSFHAGTPGPAGSPIANPPAASAAEIEQVRQQLILAWQRLATLLEPNWQAFLQLPGEILNGGNTPVSREVVTALEHYETVASDAKFAALTQRAEFTSVHQLLRQYVNLRGKADAAQLSLPAPPARQASPIP